MAFTVTAVSGTKAGDGTATPFTLGTTPFHDSAQIVIWSWQPAGGPATLVLLVEDTDYTVAIATPTPGIATITPDAAIAVGTEWIWYRATTPNQTLGFTHEGTFPSKAVEEQLDLIAMLAAELVERADRSMHQPRTEALQVQVIPGVADRANKLAGWDGTGLPTAVDPATLSPPSILVGAAGQTLLPLATFALWLSTMGGVANGGNMAKIQAGTEAARAAIAPATFGTGFFITTDQLGLWYSSGSAWTRVFPEIFTNATFPATPALDRWLVDSDLKQMYIGTGAAPKLIRSLPPQHINGLHVTPASGSTISITKGWARDSTDVVQGQLAAGTSRTLNTTGDWSEGTNLVPASVVSAGFVNKRFPVFAIFKPDGTMSFGVDLEANYLTAAELIKSSPASAAYTAGYRYARRIGWLRTDGTSSLSLYTRNGNTYSWVNPKTASATVDINANTGDGYLYALDHGFPEVEVWGPLNADSDSAASEYSWGQAETAFDNSPQANSSWPTMVQGNGDLASGLFWLRLNGSRQFRLKEDGNDTTLQLRATVLSWRDDRDYQAAA